MSLRRLFAQNLRRLCVTKKSYAQVARDLDINRQQFNGYITGKNLPNETVIDKICAYFDVDVGDMFRESDQTSELSEWDVLSPRHKRLLDRFLRFEKHQRNRGLANGLYNLYFSIPNDCENVAKSLLAVRREGALSVFRRITRVGGTDESVRPKMRGIHSGWIMSRSNVLFFVGFDELDDFTPSFLVAHPVHSSKVLYAGKGEVYIGSGFENVSFVLTSIPKSTSVGDALKSVKILPFDALQDDKMVIEMLRNKQS